MLASRQTALPTLAGSRLPFRAAKQAASNSLCLLHAASARDCGSSWLMQCVARQRPPALFQVRIHVIVIVAFDVLMGITLH